MSGRSLEKGGPLALASGTGDALPMPTFGRATPILRVRDLAASVDHYVRVLGFSLDWEAPEGDSFVSLSREECTLFLSGGGQGHPGAWVWIGVADARALHEELLARGARIRHPPTNYWWAMEMQVEDLDGNVLRLGSERSEVEPLGEWLDMEGVRWGPVEGGGWRRVEA